VFRTFAERGYLPTKSFIEEVGSMAILTGQTVVPSLRGALHLRRRVRAAVHVRAAAVNARAGDPDRQRGRGDGRQDAAARRGAAPLPAVDVTSAQRDLLRLPAAAVLQPHNPYLEPGGLQNLAGNGLRAWDCRNVDNPQTVPVIGHGRAPHCLVQGQWYFQGETNAYPHVRRDGR
jgi:hypothetical protein